MDIHTIVVHFPIALLTTYSVLEMLRFRRLLEKSYWFYVKAMLVILGSIASVAALISGFYASDRVKGIRLIDMHENFAILTVIIFALIAIIFLVTWWRQPVPKMNARIMVPLAILGLLSVTITGGLGGAITYGTNFDPFMGPLFKLLGV